MIKINRSIKLSMLACAVLMLLILPVQIFGQSTNVALSGTVQDTTKGVLPGATITVINVATGVETTTLTNDSGVFNFPSLQPGIYRVSAGLDGFQTSTKTDLDLTGIQQSRLDFELQVAGLSEELEVITTAQDILTESSSSTGTVLRSEEVVDLPLTSNDVMELVNIMGGVTPIDGSDIFNRQSQDFAGVNANGVHVQQDGITLNDVRYNTGIASQSRINTEMVSEFKLVLSPVDAEMGRGVGQVQILTKSGANQYHGSGVWNITNSALDANSWANNRSGYTPNWRNLNTYTLTVSGPIKKNKTFFFVSWDHSLPATRSAAVPGALTPCARKGIYRYFQDWMGWNYDQNVTGSNDQRRRAAVDLNGFPLDQSLADAAGYSFVGLDDGDGVYVEGDEDNPLPSGTGSIWEYGDPIIGGHYAMPNMGDLQFVSVFGPLTDETRALVMADPINCSQYDPYAGGYDMSNPMSAQSLDALGISRYYEDFDPDSEDDAVYRLLDTQAIPNFSEVMPLPNDYRTNGDGLNYATHRWTRSQHGSDNIYGVGEENARKNLSAKIDHNFNDRHRMSANITYERDRNPSASPIWPNGFPGTSERDPRRFSVSLTSSLRPTLLNEFRFGLNRNVSHSLNALDATERKDEITALMQSMVDTTSFQNFPAGEPLVYFPNGFRTNYAWGETYSPTQSHFIGGRIQNSWGLHSFLPSWGGFDHRWQLTDTLTWTKGRHSFKFGGDMRLNRSHQDADGDIGFTSRLSMPTVQGGFLSFSRPQDLTQAINREVLPGLIGTQSFSGSTVQFNGSTGALRGMLDLREYMAGSVGYIWQWFFINDPEQKSWNAIEDGEINRILDIRYKEFSFFAKDDWKVNNNLTLNLGLRYEYYGVPWLDNGMTLGLQGGSTALFGINGRDFSTWMPAVPVDYGLLDESYYTRQEFIGPGSVQPDISAFSKDLNNFGPAVGFAWQLPWFGKGKTTLRGGYQLSYSQVANADAGGSGFSSVLAGSTGTNFDFYFTGNTDVPYMRVADTDSYLPTIQYLQEEGREIEPLSTLYVENRTGTLAAYDLNIRNPYTQSLNMSITRNIGSHVTLSVRYIGTLGRKGIGSLDLNSNNWISNGLIDDFNIARAGGTTERLDKLFMGVMSTDSDLGDLASKAVGSDGGPTGGDMVRALWTTQLSEGDFNAIAGEINTYNYEWSQAGCWPAYPWICYPQYGSPAWLDRWPGTNGSLPQPGTNEQGALLRHANTLYQGEFPENFIVANPQLDTATWYTNLNHNNYHSMQVQFNLRPTHGFSMNATYTWSKNLGNSGYTNPNDRANLFDYTYTGNSRSHQLNMYGSLELPLGANGFFFRDVTNPVVRRLIEGWNLSWITRLNSGSWTNLSADATHLYGNSVPNIVRPDLFDPKSGKVVWKDGAYSGNYFSQYDFVEGPDLQCFDENIVHATYEWNSDLQRRVLIPEQSLQDECRNNMSALYTPLYETVTQLQYIDPDDPDLGVEEVTFDRLVYSEENVVFQHPMPGEYGTFGRNKILGIGSWNMDMAMWKDFQLTEGKSIGFRVDAGNIFNHPSPGNFTSSISQGGSVLGYIGSKSGQRRFQAKITVRF